MTFQKYFSIFIDSKLSLPLVFAEGIALEITQKFPSRTVLLYEVFWVFAVIAYVIFYVNWTVNMQGRLCDFVLKGCGLDFLSFFSSWLCLFLSMKHIPHTFLSSKLQEHVEVQLRIGAADGFVLIKRTHLYTRKWEKGAECKELF